MSSGPIVRYVGFAVKPLVREYTFSVRDGGNQREFTLNIANEAFLRHLARYQDAPAICALRLNSELAANLNQPPDSHFAITASELESYQKARKPAVAAAPYARKPQEDF